MSKTAEAWVAEGMAPAAPVDTTLVESTTPPVVVDSAPAGVVPPASPADPAGSPPPVGAGAGAGGEPVATQAEIEMLEALLDAEGTKKLAIPLTARVPWKQKGEEGFMTVKEMRENSMFHRDYTRNMQTLSQSRREHERAVRAQQTEQAALTAQKAALDAEIARYQAAFGDPDALARLVQDQERLASDPEYRQLHEDATAKRLADARSTADSEMAQWEESQTVADDAAAYITQVSAQYPGVDPEAVRQHLADALLTGRMTIGAADGQFNARTVNQQFQQEATRLKGIEDRVKNPLLEELNGYKSRLEALEAGTKNTATVAALRATGTTTNGAPPSRAQAPPATTPLAVVPGETLSERGGRWARRPQ